jgi:rhodanese-related sulfurtransferase
LSGGKKALSRASFLTVLHESDALILDTRSPQEFGERFIPCSINIGIDGDFAPWAGSMIPDVRQAILLVTDPGREEETITRLARVGHDNCLGFLSGGVEACAGGYRSMMFISILRARKYRNLINITEGFSGMRSTGKFCITNDTP